MFSTILSLRACRRDDISGELKLAPPDTRPEPSKVLTLLRLGPVFSLALLGALVSAYAFFPGIISHDSLEQYRQAAGTLPWRNWHPVIVTYVFLFSRYLFDSPGGLLLLHQCLYWAGVAGICLAVSQKLWTRLLLVTAVGFFPPVWIISLHLEKDAAMLGGLYAGSAAIIAFARTNRKYWLAVAMLPIFYATAARDNAFPAVLPLVCFATYLWWRERPMPAGRRVLTVGAAGVGVLAVIMALAAFINNFHVQSASHIRAILSWDLAAISVGSGEVVVPDYVFVHPEWTNEERLFMLRKYYDPEICDTLFRGVLYASDEPNQLHYIAYVLRAIAKHPREYVWHRAKVFVGMIALRRDEVYRPYHSVIDKNEFGLKFARPQNPLFRYGFAAAEFMKVSFLYRPATYLFLAGVLVLWLTAQVLQKRPLSIALSASLCLATSSLLNALPLFIIAPSEDYRYMVWTVAAGLAAVLLAVSRAKVSFRDE